MQKKICKKCNKQFLIDENDLSFYEKIKVNPPLLCPDCRSVRRLIFRNERTLYRRKCDITGKDIISIYSPDYKYKVYDKEYWYSDKFDPMEYGVDIDFSKPFLEQFKELSMMVPSASLRVRTSENCEYNNDMSESKDCYLCARTHKSQRMLYVYRGNSSTDCTDCFQVVDRSELLYECIECVNCSRSKYLYYCGQSVDSFFLYNCFNCMNCFMCSNLRNKQYCIMNEQYTRDDYFELINQIDFGDRETIDNLYQKFKNFMLSVPRRNLTMLNAPNCTGDNIFRSNNCKDCYGVKDCENSRFLLDIMKYKDSMDAYSGGRGSEMIYECTATAACSRIVAGIRIADSHDVFYSWAISTSSNIFGCIGLKSKEYCILNKQYTREEYEKLIPKIIENMNNMPYIENGIEYKYGEFFPESFSPFAYNETTAQEYYPLHKPEILALGYSYREQEEKNYLPTILPNDLSRNIKDVNDEIVGEIIGCSHSGTCEHQCTKAFKIIQGELEFYKRMNIPLPRECPNCRHYNRLQFRNPIRLWERECMCEVETHSHGNSKCQTIFDTSYAPDRPEIVYCDQCYKQEVY